MTTETTDNQTDPELERLARVFLAAGCEEQSHPFTDAEWETMHPVDKRAILAGVKAVVDSVRGAVEDE
jgi:hypothetical protein